MNNNSYLETDNYLKKKLDLNLKKSIIYILLIIIIIGLNFYKKSVNMIKNNYVITFEKNDALEIGDSSLSCEIKNSSCSITMPKIIAKNGYEVIGWSKNSNDKTADYLVGKTYKINENIKLYAITKYLNNENTYTLKFDTNGVGTLNISNNELRCTTNENSCDILMPSINLNNEYELLGWTKDKDSNDVDYLSGQIYKINKNMTLYAVVRKKYFEIITVNFNKNAALSIESTSLSCQTNGYGCEITMPKISAKSGYEVVGWSSSSDATVAMYKVGSAYTFDKNITLYAIVKKVLTAYTVTFDKNTAVSIEKTSLSCPMDEYGCKITMPKITAKSGYEVVGWSTSRNATVAMYKVGDAYTFDKNITLYAIVKKVLTTYTVTFDKNTAVGIESTSLSCQVNGTSCKITMPKITEDLGYEVVGWASSSDATMATYKVGETYSFNKNTTLYAIVKKNIFLTGSELDKFKIDNNINKSTNIVVEKTTNNSSGITFNIYYVYDRTSYDFKNLNDFKTFASNSLKNLSRVDNKVLHYVKSYGTDIIFFGNYTCDQALVSSNELGFTYAAYANSLTRDVIIAYEKGHLNSNYYEESIIHEFGHAFDFTLRYVFTNDTQVGISQLSKNDILNGFTNKNNTFVSSSKIINLFYRDSSNYLYNWVDLAKDDASKLSTIDGFTAYNISDLIALPHEFFADTFSAYFVSMQRSTMKSIAPNTYASIEHIVNYIK